MNLEHLQNNITKYVKLSCPKCHGRGYARYSFPANIKINVPNILEWTDYCSCVKNRMNRVPKNEAKDPVKVFECGVN